MSDHKWVEDEKNSSRLQLFYYVEWDQFGQVWPDGRDGRRADKWDRNTDQRDVVLCSAAW